MHFDNAAERRLRNKIDLMIVPTVSLLYLFCFIDRANIGNARLAGLERELNMSGYDYNGVLSVFYISYIVSAKTGWEVEDITLTSMLLALRDPLQCYHQKGWSWLGYPGYQPALWDMLIWHCIRGQLRSAMWRTFCAW